MSASVSTAALIIGATGQVGEFGRRTTPDDQIATGKDKLTQGTIDFETVNTNSFGEQKWDDVFITLGTTRKTAGSDANFEKIDREYVINAAKAAKNPDPEISQKLLYVSSTGANSSSPFLYPRSKGLTEEGLARLGYSDTIVFRPALLQGTNRPETRIAESLFGKFTKLASYFTDTMEIEISTLAKAVAVASKLGSEGLPPSAGATKVKLEDGTSYTVIGNAGAIALSKL